ncbi:MAG: hypothetical protein DWQ01_17690 [Planctomycetota bacterium]|nr:MAG: hypothetical protein DWQ01_17690 [Planctomycetota bacterium]
MGHTGKNIVIVLTLLAAGFFAAYLRFKPYLDQEGIYTDGSQVYHQTDDDSIRYAVWDQPEPLAANINSQEAEGRPALSPDGRLLVFAVGRAGLNLDLYVADVVDGEPLDPRPLAAVNSDFDDSAPAFSGDYLYFSSNRPGGKGRQDVYRVAYLDGLFGSVEHLLGEINSEADDTDPAPVPGSPSLALSSNRAQGLRKDFDLYLARPVSGEIPGETLYQVQLLDVVNTPFEEREPSFAADGRHLFFASDRHAANEDDFNLYRSVQERGEWLPARPLEGVNDAASQRAPVPSEDGFTLWFVSTDSDGDPDLFKARSLELFRLPGRPVGWWDLAILASLLLLALLAFLAKRWERLDIVYKCMLISLLVHLGMLWWFRKVVPDSSGITAPDGKKTINITLVAANPGITAERRERSGSLNTERSEVARAESPDRLEAEFEDGEPTEATSREVVRADSQAVSAPSREVRETDRSSEALAQSAAQKAVATETPEVEIDRQQGDAPSLEVAAQEAQATDNRQSGGTAANPDRLASERLEEALTQASERSVNRQSAQGVEAPDREIQEADRAAASEQNFAARRDVEVDSPQIQIERQGDAAPDLAMSAQQAETGERQAAGIGSDPSRLESERFENPLNSAPERNLAKAEGEASQAPERVATSPDRSSEAMARSVARKDVDTDAPEVQIERQGADAPDLALAYRDTETGERSTRGAGQSPDRLASEEVGGSQAQPKERASQFQPGAPEYLVAAEEHQAVPSQTSEEVASAVDVAVAQQKESFERASGAAPALTVAAREDLLARQQSAAGFLSRPKDLAPDTDSPAIPRAGQLMLPSQPSWQAQEVAQRDPNLQAPLQRQGVRVAPDVVRLDTGEEVYQPKSSGQPSFEVESAAPMLAFERMDNREQGPGRLRDPGELAVAGADSLRPEERQVDRARPSQEDYSPVARRDTAEFQPGAQSSADVAMQDGGEVQLGSSEAVQKAGQPPELALNPADTGRERTTRLAEPGPDRRDYRPAREESRTRPDFKPLTTLERVETEEKEELPERLEQTPYRTRFGDEKEVALRKFGGSAATEKAVADGLAYLARIQNPLGFWGSQEDFHNKYGYVAIGKTGLCVLAFLGAGHTPDSDTEYSNVVRKAVEFLLNVQDEDSGHFGFSTAYGHGVTTYALAECYALTNDAGLRPALERAVAHIIRNQTRSRDERRHGGWGYFNADGPTFDSWPRVSVSAWQVMALESARLGGLEVPDRVFDEAREFLLKAYDPRKAWFRYNHNPTRLRSNFPTLPASTPAALFALSLLGEDINSPELIGARIFTVRRAPKGYRYTGEDDFVMRAQGNLYFWYYGSLAMFRAQGEVWERWNGAMKATLIPSQQPDGSWRPISVYADYAGDDDEDRSYTTAMCVLTLEVYYRYFTPLLSVKPR